MLLMSNPYRSTILVTFGNILTKAFAFLATVILMRGLTPAQFGTVMTMVSLMSILYVLMDFGSGSCFLKMFPTMKQAGLVRDIHELLGSALLLRCVLGIPLFVLGLLFSRPLAGILLHQTADWLIIVLALVGGLTGAGFQFILVVLQADEAFQKLVLTQLIDAVLKAAGAGIVVYFLAEAGVFSGVGVFVLAPLGAILFSILFFGRHIPKPTIPKRKQMRTFFQFSSWYMVSTVSLMIFMNFDYLILAAFRPAEEVGYFGSAMRLGMMLFLIVQAINTVLMPHAGKKTKPDEMLIFFARTVKRTTILSVVIFPAVFLGPWLIRLIAGPAYMPAVSTWYWVSLDQIAQLLLTPTMIVLFGINRPRFLAGYVVLEMILNIVGDLLVVSRFGADGVAAVTLVVRLIIGVAATIHVLYGLKYKTGFMHSIDGHVRGE